MDLAGPEFRRLVEDVQSLAERELRSASGLGGGLAAISSLSADVLDDRNGSITRSLDELRRWARELIPTDDLGAAPAGRRFGIFSRPDRTRAYEQSWTRAQKPLQATVARLRDAVAQLRADNAMVADEQLAIDTRIATLNDYSKLAQQLDERLGSVVEALTGVDDTRADVLKRELLVEVRQRRTTILTQLTVAIQAKAALRIIEENNLELIDAVTSATTGTIGVLQTAATVGQALEVRRRLQTGLQRRAVEDRDRGHQIPEEEALKRAWADVGETLNQVERLRRQVSESAAMLTRSDMR